MFGLFKNEEEEKKAEKEASESRLGRVLLGGGYHHPHGSAREGEHQAGARGLVDSG